MEAHAIILRLAGDLTGTGGAPVTHRLVQGVWEAVIDGTLANGERLPTARQLAVELGVSPRSVEWAYAELQRLGVVAARQGEGTFVGLEPPDEEARARHLALAELCRDAVARAQALGFGATELIDALVEYRTSPSPPTKEPTP